MYIDTHCHLYKEYYDNLEEIIDTCRSKKISIMIVNGCDKKSSIETLELANKYPEIYAAIGFHPTELDSFKDGDIEWLKTHVINSKVVAIGEIGLDYHYDNTDKEKEIDIFEQQLILAETIHLPVIIHSRDATKDTIDILKKYHVQGIIHGFSGSLETAREFIKLGFKLGVNGVVTFKNAHLKEVIKEIGIKHIVLETDSPYLTPHPYRGTTNYPYNVSLVADFLANYLAIPLQELLMITNKNVEEVLEINLENHI